VRRTRSWSASAVRAAVVVLAAASVAGFLDRFAWPFELVTIFRLQYAVVLALLAAPALLLGARRTALVAILVASLNVASVAPPLDDRAEAAAPGAPLRLLLVNVEAGNDRYDELVRLVRKVRPDAIGVTELDATWAGELARRLPGYRHRLLVPQDGAYGAGVYSRLPLEARVHRFPATEGPPTIVARLRPPGGDELTFVVTHVHTPFAGSIHARQLEALAAARPRLGRRVAVCGDFNTVPWSAAFRRLADHGLVDLYDGSWPGYSWPTWSPFLRLPIDNCLVAGVIVADHRHGPDIGSDHYPLIVDLSVPRSS
jgi:endonuclease/exonuclease/phosphatase (EEP) superfamily protein YafD